MEIASSTEQLSHEAHVDGVATLNVVLEDHAVFMEFESPAMNLLGFEHAPVNDEQNALFISTQRTLANTSRLFSFSATVCQVENVAIQMPDRHSHRDSDQHQDYHGEHADIHARYMFQCQQIKDLKQIMIKLFILFSGIHQIKTQWISHGTQGATPDQSICQRTATRHLARCHADRTVANDARHGKYFAAYFIFGFIFSTTGINHHATFINECKTT